MEEHTYSTTPSNSKASVDGKDAPDSSAQAKPQEGLISDFEIKNFKRLSKIRQARVFIGFFVWSAFIGFCFVVSVIAVMNNTPFHIIGITLNKSTWLLCVSIFLTGLLCRNFWLFISHWHLWKVATQEAQNIADVESVVHGFTSLFRMYVRTRAAGYFAYIWSLLGFFNLYFYGIALMFKELFDFTSVIPYLTIVSVINLIIGYLLSNSYKIGIVLVDFLGIIAYRSAHQMHTDSAQAKTRDIAAKHRKMHYWWFY